MELETIQIYWISNGEGRLFAAQADIDSIKLGDRVIAQSRDQIRAGTVVRTESLSPQQASYPPENIPFEVINIFNECPV